MRNKRTKTIQKQHRVEEFVRVLREHLPELQKRYGVSALGIFGSYVHGKQKRKSDLDILVEFERAPTFFQFIELEDRISELLGVKIDLVMKSALKPLIGERILAEVVII